MAARPAPCRRAGAVSWADEAADPSALTHRQSPSRLVSASTAQGALPCRAPSSPTPPEVVSPHGYARQRSPTACDASRGQRSAPRFGTEDDACVGSADGSLAASLAPVLGTSSKTEPHPLRRQARRRQMGHARATQPVSPMPFRTSRRTRATCPGLVCAGPGGVPKLTVRGRREARERHGLADIGQLTT
jgi:hypothetical protein